MRHPAFLQQLAKLVRLHYGPALRLYKGFGNATECTIYGHALSLSPIPRKRYRNFILFNTAALLRLFMVKPVKKACIELRYGNEKYTTYTEDDGFFHFQWKPSAPLLPGIYSISAAWMENNQVIATAEADFIIPSSTDYAFISDIDDTFLISHSSNLRKRLYVLLTHNARSRRPFDGAVKHYQLLEQGKKVFFYVSSSEWNLYDYIREFIRVQQLPDGSLLLNQLKTFSRLMATGQGKHHGKFTRIVRILEAYPDQSFVLLGDDSQQDPFIYARLVEHFPRQIYAVYIRRLKPEGKKIVTDELSIIEQAGVHSCYFYHSEEAIAHSYQVGLIQQFTT